MLLLALPHQGLAQTLAARSASPAGAIPTRQTTAAFAEVAPVIDARDDDPVWRSAPLITQFVESVPVEGATPRFRTTGRIAADGHNLYVFLRAYDPHPDSIATMLARRDVITPSDVLGVLIDSWHDRRSGYELDVNPSGVKLDFSIQNDGDEDPAWDGVWDVATRIDSLGWAAEFRIPLSQLRYRGTVSDTFGIALYRNVERTAEKMNWPQWRPSRPGLPSQFGELTGLDHLASPRRVELVPYLLTRNLSTARGQGFGRSQEATAGADFKYRPASNLTLTGTVNPDFGQVEADPAELNLTAFETFFPEQRPFFVEDARQFDFGLNCGQYSCYRETLFYSRRIGRSPELLGLYGDAGSPTATRILGAAKVTGRTGGFGVGVLGAATQRVGGPHGNTLEPAARYGVLRATEDLRGGETGLGVMLTGMGRGLDASSAPYLHHEAWSGGVDFHHRFQQQYLLHGSAHWSRVTGSPAAIAATQRDPVHNYQRPDGAVALDTTRTALAGDDEQLAFDKLGGSIHFQAIYTRRSPGFEVNDLGYLRLADQQTANAWLGLALNHPTRWYRSLLWNFNAWIWATTAGLVTDRAVNTNVHLTLPNLWRLGAWVSFDGLGSTFCDRCARGGPALRQDRSISTWFDVRGDERRRLMPWVTVTTGSADAGRSSAYSVAATTRLNASSRLSASLGVRLAVNHNHTQWYGNPVDASGRTHYTFAALDQRTIGVTVRADYAVSPTLSLQAYLQPFASWGSYRDIRELSAPRAASYADRFVPYVPTAGSPLGVSSRQLNANVVLRWEYRPGSTLFVVWSQARQGFSDTPANGGTLQNLGDVFGLRADNTFLVKLSYWFNW